MTEIGYFLVQRYVDAGGKGPKSAGVGTYIDAGFDEIYLSQVGPDQERFLEFYRDELAPLLGP